MICVSHLSKERLEMLLECTRQPRTKTRKVGFPDEACQKAARGAFTYMLKQTATHAFCPGGELSLFIILAFHTSLSILLPKSLHPCF